MVPKREGKEMSKHTNNFRCLDCGIDTGKISEYYYLNNNLWESVNPTSKGMLCLGCVENRLGRELQRSDFTGCFLNNPKCRHSSMSDRFFDRLNKAGSTHNTRQVDIGREKYYSQSKR